MYSREGALGVVSASPCRLRASKISETRTKTRRQSRRKPKTERSLALGTDRRLHYRWQYKRFFGHSEVFRFSECTVFRVKNDLGHFRLGITLKARGSSVDRNRVKRQVRESFRTMAPHLGSFDYNVVIPASKKLGHPYPQRLGKSLRKELTDAFGPR